jgi:hypothetical protein
MRRTKALHGQLPRLARANRTLQAHRGGDSAGVIGKHEHADSGRRDTVGSRANAGQG